MSVPTECPACKADLDGGEIPEESRQHYSPPYRWSRCIGIYCTQTDRVHCWRCPDCGHEWRREDERRKS